MKSGSRLPLGPDWIACPFCEAHCRKRELLPGQELRCLRCDSTVMLPIAYRTLQPPFALSLAGLFLLLLANMVPILTFDVVGRTQADFMITGVIELCRQGYFPIGLLVFFSAILAPALYLGCVFYIGCALVLRLRMPGIRRAFAIAHAVNPWNLIPVYSIATVVSVVKLRMLGEVSWQPGARFVLGVAIMTMLCQQITHKQVALDRLEEMGLDVKP